MDALITELVQQAPAVAVLIFLVWRLDVRLEELQDLLVELCKAEQAALHAGKNEEKH